MASEFSTEFFSANRIVKADLRAARTPREEDLERIKKEVGKLYDATASSITPAATPSTR